MATYSPHCSEKSEITPSELTVNPTVHQTADLAPQAVDTVETLDAPTESAAMPDLSAQEIADNRQKLVQLLATSDGDLWQAGDLIIALESKGVKRSTMSADTGWSEPRLSQLQSTAKTFNASERDASVPFYTYELARKADKKVVQKAKKRLGNNPSPEIATAIAPFAVSNPVAALKLVLAEEQISGKKTKSRTVTQIVAAPVKAAIKAVTPTPKPKQEDEFLNRCFNMDCCDLLDAIIAANVPWTAKLIVLDPPYGAYKKVADGSFSMGTSAASHKSGANLSRKEAIDTTVKVIGKLKPLMGVGTAVHLWQPSIELRLPILQAIEDAGLAVEMAVVWDKGIGKLGNGTDPYTQRCEFCWILKLKDTTLVSHTTTESDFGNVMSSTDKRFAFHTNAADLEDTHPWGKPVTMLESQIDRHTDKGEIVLELYGCTGSGSIAAANMGRPFIYCEMNKDNFDGFSPHVLAALEAAQKKTESKAEISGPELQTGTKTAA